MDELDPTTFTLDWLPGWIRKSLKAKGYKPPAVAGPCKVTPTRIRQVQLQKNPAIAPPELLWRITALVKDDEEEYADLSDEAIQAVLSRLITVLGPHRLCEMAKKSGARLERQVELGELELRKRETRLALTSSDDES